MVTYHWVEAFDKSSAKINSNVLELQSRKESFTNLNFQHMGFNNFWIRCQSKLK